ncbi:MAG: PA0069 family radical SAM protein [Verrucomicrobiota bacterium]|nr:PA0069 family radical SAM protein [Limisphaera sp.]MDW8382239.1 PA0069 family radical SAM protein [Verrucomicrobiota bacterium]
MAGEACHESGTSRGRGTGLNPPNRFEPWFYEPDPEGDPEDRPLPRTRFFLDRSVHVLSFNDSPDLGFDVSLNPYRGCEHGCAYCYARPTHEYLGFSSGLDFESIIIIKPEAPELLRAELASPRWQPRTIALSGVTDCYQPIERRLQLTRRCLAVLAEFRNPVCVVTKNFLVTRDIDLLTELAGHQAVVVCLSISTLDAELARCLEPRAALPQARLKAIESLAKAGIPVGVLMAPIIPGLTDHEMFCITQAAAGAGASFACYSILRLPHAVQDIFLEWLERHRPLQKSRVLSRLQEVREGKLSDARFGTRLTGTGPAAQRIAQAFTVACRRAGLDRPFPVLSAASFRVPGPLSRPEQMELPIR